MTPSMEITVRDLVMIAEKCVVDTEEACSMMECSRQYINELVKSGRLRVINKKKKVRLYMRNDIEKMTW